MKNSNNTIGKQTRYLPVCSAVPQTTAPPRTGETTSFIFVQKMYLNNIANPSKFCNETRTVMIAKARRYSTRNLHVGTDCLQQIRVLELIRPFVLLLRHGYCLVKNIKSIRELVMFKDKKWCSRSFI